MPFSGMTRARVCTESVHMWSLGAHVYFEHARVFAAWLKIQVCSVPLRTGTYAERCSCACACAHAWVRVSVRVGVLSCHKAAVTYELPDTLMGSDMLVVPIGWLLCDHETSRQVLKVCPWSSPGRSPGWIYSLWILVPIVCERHGIKAFVSHLHRYCWNVLLLALGPVWVPAYWGMMCIHYWKCPLCLKCIHSHPTPLKNAPPASRRE